MTRLTGLRGLGGDPGGLALALGDLALGGRERAGAVVGDRRLRAAFLPARLLPADLERTLADTRLDLVHRTPRVARTDVLGHGGLGLGDEDLAEQLLRGHPGATVVAGEDVSDLRAVVQPELRDCGGRDAVPELRSPAHSPESLQAPAGLSIAIVSVAGHVVVSCDGDWPSAVAR